MKSLGYLFVILVFVGIVGFFRGWFTVEASTNAGRTDVTLGVDSDKIVKDATVSKKGPPEAAVGSAAANPAATAGATIEGRVTAVDAAAQDLTLEVLEQRSVHHIGKSVTITRDGAPIAFVQLRTDMRVRLRFAASGAPPDLLEVVVMP